MKLPMRPLDAEAKQKHNSLIAGLVRTCLYCFLFFAALQTYAHAEVTHSASPSAAATAQVPADAAVQDVRTARLLRNAGIASLLSIIGLWIFISARRLVRESLLAGRPITLRQALGNLGAQVLAVLDRINRTPQTGIGALLSSLACIAASAIFATLSWSKATHLEPGLLEVPWRYAMIAVGFSVSAALLVICAVREKTAAIVSLTPAYLPRIRFEKLAPWLLASICILILICFRWLDLWNNRFSDRSWHYTMYGFARLLFIPFLAAALLGTGVTILNRLEHRFGNLRCTPIEKALTAFLCGTAAWYVILLPGSLAGFMQYHLIAPLFVLAVWFSAPVLIECSRIACRWLFDRLNKATLISLLLVSMPISVLIFCWTHLLVDKGLAVTGLEYDSYGHYVPYYQAVLEQGGTGINELWHHFWISKGAALHLVATLLTDIHGPQLVSFTFLTVTTFLAVLLIFFRPLEVLLSDCVPGRSFWPHLRMDFPTTRSITLSP